MNFFSSLVILTGIFNFGSGLRIYFNLHITEGTFPKIIQIVVSCKETTANKLNQNETIDDITLPDDLERRKKPITLKYGKFLISDIKVNSTERYKCNLVTPLPRIYYNQVKTRVKRELKASIPAEFGVCRSGYSLASYDRCFPCHPGTYGSGVSSKCLPCPKNYYGPLPAQDSCYACPKGSITFSEGSDNEQDCIYVDVDGKPLPRISTKVIVIISCVSIFVLLVIIGFIVWFFVLRKRTKPKKPKLRKARPEIIRIDQGPLFMKDSQPFYRQGSDSDEHIYAEIDEFQYDSDDYLDPIKLKQQPIYTKLVDSEHIYEEPPFYPVSISEGTFHCKKPQLRVVHASNKANDRKQKESSTRSDHKSKRLKANRSLKDTSRERNGKAKGVKHVDKNETKTVNKRHLEDLHNIKLPFNSNSTGLKQHQQSRRNSKLGSSETLAEGLVRNQKRSSNGAKHQAPYESQIIGENLNHLLKNILKDAKYSENSKGTSIGLEGLEPVSNTRESGEKLIEMSLKQAEIHTDQKNAPDLIKGKREDSNSTSEAAMDIFDNLDLPEINDSRIF